MRLDELDAMPKKDRIHVVVETPRGATEKLKWEPDPGIFTLKRPLPLGFAYPYDWGFVPGTRGDDGDPIDALVVWEMASPPGTVLRCRALGVLELAQDGSGGRERNDRILAVPDKDERTSWLASVDDLPQRIRDELAWFFLASIHFTKKNAKVLGWGGPEAALALVARSRVG
jgi:inorganic pyrophosphatase